MPRAPEHRKGKVQEHHEVRVPERPVPWPAAAEPERRKVEAQVAAAATREPLRLNPEPRI